MDREKEIGKTLWVIADGLIASDVEEDIEFNLSYDKIAILNLTSNVALVEIMFYFSDQDPLGPYRVTVPGERTKQVKLVDLEDPEPLPHNVDYACIIKSNVPIIVQHTRINLDRNEKLMLSAVAYSE